MAEIPCSSRLERVLQTSFSTRTNQQHIQNANAPTTNTIVQTGSSTQIHGPNSEILRRLLCQRPALPKFPADILEDIEAVLTYWNCHNLLTSTKQITPASPSKAKANCYSIRISCWKGDITTLADITAIVNAANSATRGLFSPQASLHR